MVDQSSNGLSGCRVLTLHTCTREYPSLTTRVRSLPTSLIANRVIPHSANVWSEPTSRAAAASHTRTVAPPPPHAITGRPSDSPIATSLGSLSVIQGPNGSRVARSHNPKLWPWGWTARSLGARQPTTTRPRNTPTAAGSPASNNTAVSDSSPGVGVAEEWATQENGANPRPVAGPADRDAGGLLSFRIRSNTMRVNLAIAPFSISHATSELPTH